MFLNKMRCSEFGTKKAPKVVVRLLPNKLQDHDNRQYCESYDKINRHIKSVFLPRHVSAQSMT